MSHRVQVTIPDEQYGRLLAEARRAGVPVSELIRQAVEHRYPAGRGEELLRALDASFSAWVERDFDGEGYVEAIRAGMAHRLAES
jgi:hypothetical protein